MEQSSLRKRWSAWREWLLKPPPETSPIDPAELRAKLDELRRKTPAPVLWLFGKTQSGKTSLVKFLTGATDAEVGNGFRPCTRTSRRFPFPTPEDPVLTFLDTRGVDEPGYDATDDLAAFDPQAHLVLVTVRLKDFATGPLRASLARIRQARPSRPVVLMLTCLHEAFPQQQHPQPYPVDASAAPTFRDEANLPPDFPRLVREQTALFAGLADRVVPVDLTRPDEGFTDTAYGGTALKEVLLATLPDAYRTVFAQLTELADTFRDNHLHRAMPVILRATTLAVTAAVTPIPGMGLVVLPGLQTQMLDDLAAQTGTPAAVHQFLGSLGQSLRSRQALRELVKFVPGIGAAASAALAGRATYALGVAFCEYLHATELGRTMTQSEIRDLYDDRFAAAAKAWHGPRPDGTA